MRPAPLFRSTITLGRPVRRARLYATALGVYELHLNGRRVGRDRFNPGWTDYAQRVQYHTYDVTSLLRDGPNVLGLILGDGWYSGFVGLGGRERYGKLPLARAQLEVEFIDGTRQRLVTDSNWKATPGPIQQSDMLMGESYDARLECPGWSGPGFDDTDWEPVVTQPVAVTLVAARDEPVRPVMEIKPVASSTPLLNHHILDLGQNIVGHVRVKLRGKPGDRIRIRYAEMLSPDGLLYTENLREARATDFYTLKSDREETYEPHFTLHGFRYVELYDYPGRLRTDAVTGIAVQADVPPAGTFECSNTNLTRLWQNIDWTQRNNLFSVPTDAPQRDQRLGQTGPAQLSLRSSLATRNGARLFNKWLQDLADAQQPGGAFPDFAPSVEPGSGTAAWGDAGVVVPWTLFEITGDRRVLEVRYAAAARWIDYLQQNSREFLRPAAGFGDWLAPDAGTPKDMLATAWFAHSAQLMAKIATALGRSEDARRYETLFDRIKTAFVQAYVSTEGRVAGNTQTADALALEFDLLPQNLRPTVAAHLVADLKARGYHPTTGYLGSPFLLPALSGAGQLKTAYRVLFQTSVPSFFYPTRHGATTIWERWDSWTADGGFQDPSLNSFNQTPLGAIADWLLGTVAGIAPGTDQPGFQHILIRPQPGGDLTWVRASYTSPFGPVATHWRAQPERFELDLTLPPNTTTTLVLPARSSDEVREGGRPVPRAEGVEFLRNEGDTQVFRLGSGQYRFVVLRR
jgi:alpha-L-rhamnosidase